MSSILDLFSAAGYPDPVATMVPLQRYDISDKKIQIKAFNQQTQEIGWYPVSALYYKGMSSKEDSYKVTAAGKSFLATGDHLLYNAEIQDFQKTANSIGSILGLDAFGNLVSVDVSPLSASFPILDLEVAEVENYYTAGVLSHNSFGGVAKLLSEALRKFNPILEKYRTSLIMISQERDNIGCVSEDTLVDWKPL